MYFHTLPSGNGRGFPLPCSTHVQWLCQVLQLSLVPCSASCSPALDCNYSRPPPAASAAAAASAASNQRCCCCCRLLLTLMRSCRQPLAAYSMRMFSCSSLSAHTTRGNNHGSAAEKVQASPIIVSLLLWSNGELSAQQLPWSACASYRTGLRLHLPANRQLFGPSPAWHYL